MLLRLMKEFFRFQAAAGVLLVLSAALALFFANLPSTRDLYQAFLTLPVDLQIGGLEFEKNLLLIVNDGLMALFFLLVGLEIKRELLLGELREFGRVVIPALGALGGLALPALIYLAVNRADSAAAQGWAIPAATDIAFALGVLSLFGSRVPLSLKVFLTTVAILDDLAAIVIIALFYSGNLSTTALVLAAVCVFVLLVLNRAGVENYGAYALVGLVLWAAVLKSGVHATLAGVLLAFFVPLRQQHAERDCPARHLEHALHPWIAYAVLPLFAFCNAGVLLAGIGLDDLRNGVSVGIFFGLAVGKVLGVGSFSLIAVRLGLGKLPQDASLTSFLGVCLLCGIGFTMSLFIGTLAFEEQGLHFEVATRLGVFGGSILAAILGGMVLHRSLPR
jgi:NhaA family Na+:H+ antiporter